MNSNWQSVLGVLVLLAGGANQAEAVDGSASGVYLAACPDQAPETGQEPLPGRCQDEVVGDEEADAIKQKRKEYIQGVLSKSRVQGKHLARAGSGFFVAPDGNLITNHHLVDGCALVSISPTFGDMALATIISSDEATDLALLRADLVPPGVASIVESEGAFKREPAYMIGYPNLGQVTTQPALTPVEVLGSQKTAFSVSAIAIKGEVRSGNTGGPLLDSGGGVIGVVIASANQTYAATGEAVQSVGLALPSEALRAFLDAHGIDYRVGLQLPPKPGDRILIDARPYVAQVGCWQ